MTGYATGAWTPETISSAGRSRYRRTVVPPLTLRPAEPTPDGFRVLAEPPNVDDIDMMKMDRGPAPPGGPKGDTAGWAGGAWTN